MKLSNRLIVKNALGRRVTTKRRYLPDTRGDLTSYPPKDAPSRPELAVRGSEAAGYCSLWSNGERTYLSAFINPQAGSTVTTEQFVRNRFKHDVRPGRILPWLVGQASLRDNPCLLVHMSVPLDRIPRERADATLDEAWPAWSEWWRSRFPKP